MWRRKITKQNLIEIIVIAIIFIIIFIIGSSVFLIQDVNSYNIFAVWCIITALISMVIIGSYSYIKIRSQILNYRETKEINNKKN